MPWLLITDIPSNYDYNIEESIDLLDLALDLPLALDDIDILLLSILSDWIIDEFISELPPSSNPKDDNPIEMESLYF